VVIRQLRVQDAAAFRAFLERLSPASRYARFQYVVKDVTPQLLRPLLEADPRSHVALGAFDGERLVGEARYVRRQEPDKADFAIAVDDSWQRHGLASQLMIELERHAGRDGVRRLEGEVLAGNKAMLAFVVQAGFQVHHHFEDARLVRVKREIQAGQRPPRAFYGSANSRSLAT
jgi:RimJ/RimL family protein N-acetyltransferase